MKYIILIILSFMLIGNCVAAQNTIFINDFEKIIIPLAPLNDTGITWSGDSTSGNFGSCINPVTNPANQDCNTGRDTTHPDPTDGHAGFSFTKLDATGIPLINQSVDYATTTWACVQDNVTGLVWEVKTITADIHNKDITYKWGGVTAIGLGHPSAPGTYYTDWDVLANGTNSENLCGFDNWRVPTAAELSSIVNKGTFGPAIDIDYFPNITSSWFWSSSPVVDIFPNNAWGISFSNGDGGANGRDVGFRVRLVRSGQ